MIKMYNNKIEENILEQMYKILIENLFITYPSFLKDRKRHDNQDNYDKWTNMIKTTKNYNVLIYKEKNKVLGFLNYSVIDNNLWISEVQIKNEYKNKKILKQLIREFAELNKNIKNEIVTIHIDDNNIISKKVFTHIGFKYVGNTLYKASIEKLAKWSDL